jgi:hypothetical protein
MITALGLYNNHRVRILYPSGLCEYLLTNYSPCLAEYQMLEFNFSCFFNQFIQESSELVTLDNVINEMKSYDRDMNLVIDQIIKI